MMKSVLYPSLVLSPAAASAHAGHLGELAGHDHWVAGIALGAAGAAAVWGWLKDRGRRAADGDSEPAGGTESEEAQA